jgi:spermidine/putrescine transport system substrate-binding protein
LESGLVPAAVADGLLAPIDFRNVTNFKNISADFRNLAYDPDNKHTIPYSWGTTGLVVRGDRVAAPITRWADLWDPRYAGKVVGWLLPRYTLGVALKSLGYSANSEDPMQLEAALQRLLALKPNAIWLNGDQESIAPELVDGDAAFGLGWAYDYKVAHDQNAAVTYVLPKDGSLLWVDNFVIPANSPNKTTAERFLSFLLRPEITGQLVNANYYAMPNDAAAPYIDPAILNDPVIYPANQQLKNAEILLPLSPAGQSLHDEIWERFLKAGH